MADWYALRVVLDRPSAELINQLTGRFLEIDYDFPVECLKYDDWFEYRSPIQGGDFIGSVFEEFGVSGFYALVPKSPFDCANADLTQYAVNFGKPSPMDTATVEARRLSTAVDRLEGESLEILEALGLHEDTSHEDALEHIRTLVKEHGEMRVRIDEAFWKNLP